MESWIIERLLSIDLSSISITDVSKEPERQEHKELSEILSDVLSDPSKNKWFFLSEESPVTYVRKRPGRSYMIELSANSVLIASQDRDFEMTIESDTVTQAYKFIKSLNL